MTPNFETIYAPLESAMLKDAYEAITKTDMWDYMRLKSTPGPDGFMFSSAIELAIINADMTYREHSGSSYAWTMRIMQDIARNGWSMHQLRKWAEKVRKPKRGFPCGCRIAKGYDFGWCGVAGGGVPACDH